MNRTTLHLIAAISTVALVTVLTGTGRLEAAAPPEFALYSLIAAMQNTEENAHPSPIKCTDVQCYDNCTLDCKYNPKPGCVGSCWKECCD